ncbi:MAG: TlyA family RNA methyltransferase [Fervidobacterium sp.]
MENKYIRLDQLLVLKGLVESRTKAQLLIQTGSVAVNNVIVTKSSKRFFYKDKVELIDNVRYVSRAGYKLEGFMREHKIDTFGKIACDIGSSTGGFVDYLLQNGIRKVYAVDVNIDQLHPKIAMDERVVKIEKNARLLTYDDVKDQLDIITVDVSFISLEKILPALEKLCLEKTKLIVLIKPQFETNKTRNGIVTNKKVHFEVLDKVLKSFAECNLYTEYLTFSKLPGSDGNIEFFALFSKKITEKNYTETDIIKIVDTAWEALK